jgi:hypothetical protein
MMTLTPTQFVEMMEEIRASKVPIESFSFQMTGGRFTRVAVPSKRGGSKSDVTHIRAEQFDELFGLSSENA